MLDELGIIEACFGFFYHRDVMNAAVHQSTVRFSPLTVSVANLLEMHYQMVDTAIPDYVDRVLKSVRD